MDDAVRPSPPEIGRLKAKLSWGDPIDIDEATIVEAWAQRMKTTSAEMLAAVVSVGPMPRAVRRRLVMTARQAGPHGRFVGKFPARPVGPPVKRAAINAGCIVLDNLEFIERWCASFDCSEADLRSAVAATDGMPAAVQTYLRIPGHLYKAISEKSEARTLESEVRE